MDWNQKKTTPPNLTKSLNSLSALMDWNTVYQVVIKKSQSLNSLSALMDWNEIAYAYMVIDRS